MIIEAIGGPEAKELSDIVFSATVQAVQELRPAHAPKLTYIYTSGTWVHGDNRTEVVTDSTPLTSPAELVAWRPAMEQRIITNPHLNGIVIRPSLLYGRSGSLLAPLFKSAYEGEVAWFGTPGGRLALVHCDDLAEAYLLAAEKAAIVGGKIFDASNDVNESTDAVLQRLVEISGAKGYKYPEPSNCECSDSLSDVIRSSSIDAEVCFASVRDSLDYEHRPPAVPCARSSRVASAQGRLARPFGPILSSMEGERRVALSRLSVAQYEVCCGQRVINVSD